MEYLIKEIEMNITVYKDMTLLAKKRLNKNKDISFNAIKIIKYEAKLEILEFFKNRLNKI